MEGMKIIVICNNRFWDKQYLVTDLERTKIVIPSSTKDLTQLIEFLFEFTEANEIVEFDEMRDLTDFESDDDSDFTLLTKEQLLEKAKFLYQEYIDELELEVNGIY